MDICDTRLLKFSKRGTISTRRYELFPRHCCEALSNAGWRGEGWGGGGSQEVREEHRREVWVRGGRKRVYTALHEALSSVYHALEKAGAKVKVTAIP